MKQLLSLLIANIHGFQLAMKFRKGQRPFYDAIVEGLKKGWETMYIEGPTGMGKTFIEAVVAAAMIGNSDVRVLLLTSKITLLEQIQREFKKFVGFLKTGLFGGGFKNHREQVTIMTYDSFRNISEDIAKQYQVVLLDEGHKGLGDKTRAKLELQKAFSILIGFTASATYSEEKGLKEFLINEAYKLSIVEAVELGMLSNIKVFIASVDIEIESQRKGESKGDYEERISSEIIREGGNIATARLYKRVFVKRDLRGIALVLTRNQGNDLVDQFANEGIKAELIHSGMKRAEREDMFARFRNREFSVLVGMGIIKEGFDDPGVSVAITTYPVSSIVDMTQFPGRAERIDEENPEKVAYIVNLAYKAKKQLFYTDILDGKSEVLQKQAHKKKLDIISSNEMQVAIAKKPESFITAVAVNEEEVKEVMRNTRGIETYSQEEIIELGKEELSKYGIVDRVSLIKFGIQKFKTLELKYFGSGFSFVNRVLNLKLDNINLKNLEQIAFLFEWDYEKDLNRARVELSYHNIVDRSSLVSLGSTSFKKLHFGPFGKGDSFAGWILAKPSIKTKNKDLEAIAEKLGWVDKVKTLENLKIEFAKHGIVDRVSLISLGSTSFKKLHFGPFGGSEAAANWILSEVVRSINYEKMEAIAQRLGWNDRVKTLENLKIEFAKHGITDRVSLISLGPTKFIEKDFGVFGKGSSCAGWILDKTLRSHVRSSDLEAIAQRLGWNDRVKTLENLKIEFAKHGITDRVSLISLGPTKFKSTNFGLFGKGVTVASFILKKNIGANITLEILEEISLKLSWKDSLDRKRVKLEFSKHGIVSRNSLLSVGSRKFISKEFGPFGKGTKCASWVLGSTVTCVTNQTLIEIAENLGW